MFKEPCLHKIICAFAFASFVSIAAGNIFLALMTLLFFILAAKKAISFGGYYKNYLLVYALFILTMLLSAVFSGDPARGLKVWANAWIWRFMPFLIIIFCVHSAAAAKKILVYSAAGMAIGIFCLIYQGISGDGRAAGFFGHPMTFAGYLCIYLPVFLVGFFEKEIFGRWNWLSGAVFICGCAALLFNGTRGAWLALAPVILLLAIYYMLKNKRFMITGLIFLLALSAGLSQSEQFVYRINTITDSKYQSNTERLLIWNSAFNMFKDNTVLGVGLGQYTYNYQHKYISPEAKEPKLGHAHNNFMQMLAENGIIGFLSFTVLFGYLILSNIKRFLRNRSPYALIISASAAALLLQGLTEYNFGNSAVVKCFWLVIGCLAVLDNYFAKEENKNCL